MPRETVLSITEARQFFESKLPFAPGGATTRTDSLEEASGGPLVIPDWENAVSYFDEAKQQSVVEVPILEGAFSQYLLNPENVTVDTSIFRGSPPNNRLLIVRDTAGITDYAIMKIAGTYAYLSTAVNASNTYRGLDTLFAGMINYVDIYDRLRQSYYITDGNIYVVDSIRTDGVRDGRVQDRWMIVCVRVWEEVPCSCSPHHGMGDACSCQQGKPHVISYEVCYDEDLVFLPPPSTNNPFTPPFNPNSIWNSGGSNSTTPSGGQSCFIEQVDAFDDKYGTHLLDDFEEIAFGCFLENPVCGDTTFERRVSEEIFKVELSKKPGGPTINLLTVFENCFGEPLPNGGYIDCNSNPGATFEATLYTDQPNPGTRDPYSGNPYLNTLNVGHTFISLSANLSGSPKTVTFGFYPQEELNLENQSCPKRIVDDSGHAYSVSVTRPIGCADFNTALLNSISLANFNYHLSDYNCTDYGIQVANSIGIPVGDTSSPWVFNGKAYGSSSNPGDLGEDIKELTIGTINSAGGTAPATNCN